MHRKYTIHEYQKIERSITINKVQGNIKLNLLTKETTNETLSKIKNEKVREKIKYVYLVGVQIIIKKLFPENLNTPIILKRLIQTHRKLPRKYPRKFNIYKTDVYMLPKI